MDTTALVTTIVLALAGPVGIGLGWWLGRRAERDRTGREERKAAYVRFTTSSMKFRNSSYEDRLRIRDQRWEALAVLTMVAPPSAVRVAANMAAGGERLLDPDLSQDERNAIYQRLWQGINEFTQMARADLHVGDTDAFAGLKWVSGDRLTFEHQPAVPRDEDAVRSNNEATVHEA
jgi:hypothetical protein